MRTYFIPSQDVIHPETTQPIVHAGVAYNCVELEAMCKIYGMDKIDGCFVMAFDRVAAENIYYEA